MPAGGATAGLRRRGFPVSTMSTEIRSAVFSSMAEAEQYFSCDSCTARSTAARGQVAAGHGEGEVDAGEDLGIGVGAFGLELDAAAAHSVPAALEDQDHVVGGAAARAGVQQHFHGAGRQIVAAAIHGAVHHGHRGPLPVLAVKSMPEGPPQSIVHSMCVCP